MRPGIGSRESGIAAWRTECVVLVLLLNAATALGQGAPAAASPTPSYSRWQIGVAGEARLVQHRLNAGNGVELSSGTLFGGSGRIGIGRYVELGVSVATGALTADSAQADDADLARGEAHLAFLPVPWLAVRAGAEAHTFTTSVATQRWESARLGGEARLRFVGGRLAGLLRFEFYPVMSVSGLAKPNRGFGAASGLMFESGVVTAGLLYELERYDFPATAGVERHEQLGTLSIELGLRLRK